MRPIIIPLTQNKVRRDPILGRDPWFGNLGPIPCPGDCKSQKLGFFPVVMKATSTNLKIGAIGLQSARFRLTSGRFDLKSGRFDLFASCLRMKRHLFSPDSFARVGYNQPLGGCIEFLSACKQPESGCFQADLI